VGEPRAQVGKEIGRDLLTTVTVAVVLIGCILIGGVIGSFVNNDIAVLVGGAIGLTVGVIVAVLVGLRLRRTLQ
jgi:hypothetical protein